MPDKLAFFSFLAATAALLAAAWRLPPRDAGADDDALDRRIREVDGDVRELLAVRAPMADRLEEIGLELRSVKEALDRLSPGAGAAGPGPDRAARAAETHLAALAKGLGADAAGNRARVLAAVQEDVSARLGLDAARRAAVGDLIRSQYDQYALSVKRYGRDKDKVAAEYRAAMDRGRARLAELLDAEQLARWEAGFAGWHPYLKTLFKP